MNKMELAKKRKPRNSKLKPVIKIEQRIILIRGEKVILDSDLADLYGVKTGTLTRAVRRNIERFPDDFMFQITNHELSILKRQYGTSSSWGGRRYLPYVFTEQGVAMLSSVLRSNRAVLVNIRDHAGICQIAADAGKSQGIVKETGKS